MSCDKCKETLEIDDVEPPCFSDIPSPLAGEGQGEGELIPGVNACWVPPPDERGQRILEIRDKLVRLRDLVDPGTILRLYDADLEDIELLAVVEDELKAKGLKTGEDRDQHKE